MRVLITGGAGFCSTTNNRTTTNAGVRICGADDCLWIFLDTSKNRTRRWCDMKQCGNRMKARRFYERQKDERRR